LNNLGLHINLFLFDRTSGLPCVSRSGKTTTNSQTGKQIAGRC
jgi:hypothetical protein